MEKEQARKERTNEYTNEYLNETKKESMRVFVDGVYRWEYDCKFWKVKESKKREYE